MLEAVYYFRDKDGREVDFIVSGSIADRDHSEVFRKVFRYACDNLHWKVDYPLDLWFYRIEENIKAGHPVLAANNYMKGDPEGTGHRVVITRCDRQFSSYTEGVYINNGEYGSGDEWIDVLRYANISAAIFDIQPNPDNLIPNPPV